MRGSRRVGRSQLSMSFLVARRRRRLYAIRGSRAFLRRMLMLLEGHHRRTRLCGLCAHRYLPVLLMMVSFSHSRGRRRRNSSYVTRYWDAYRWGMCGEPASVTCCCHSSVIRRFVSWLILKSSGGGTSLVGRWGRKPRFCWRGAPIRIGRRYGFGIPCRGGGGSGRRSVEVRPMVARRALWELIWRRAKMWHGLQTDVVDVMLQDRHLV